METYPFARDAIREAVYNAIAHNCYMYGSPIQIRIEEDAMIVSNRCILPEGWTVETLMEPHDFMPYNPDIANVFYRAGCIEHWGRGIEKICKACDELGATRPEYELLGNGLRVRFPALQSALLNVQSTQKHQSTDERALEETLADKVLLILEINPRLSQIEIANKLNVTRRAVQIAMKKLQDANRIVRIGSKRFGHWQIQE